MEIIKTMKKLLKYIKSLFANRKERVRIIENHDFQKVILMSKAYITDPRTVPLLIGKQARELSNVFYDYLMRNPELIESRFQETEGFTLDPKPLTKQTLTTTLYLHKGQIRHTASNNNAGDVKINHEYYNPKEDEE